MTEAAPIIRFASVQKAFGPKVVFSDLSLDVWRGETLVVLGGSGTGKSVMLKLLIGLLASDAGEILAFGQNVVGLGEEALLPLRKRVSMLFQGGALFDSLSVAENVAYPLREHSALSEADLQAKVSRTLALVGLEHTEAMKPADLSGGMRKRAALARAIVGDPEVLLYDEPTTGLDPVTARKISELIRSIQAELKVTSIVVTHDMPSAFHVADRLAMVAGGKVVAALPRAEFRASRLPEIKSFIDAARSQEDAT